MKDGTTVGSIGVLNSNNLTITGSVADHGGLQFATHSIVPMEAGVDSDGTIDLGSSGARFKDLYLSGGVYANNASGAFLWNAENAHIAFGTNNTERMRIDASGNVKIGDSATDITSKLVVSGNASADVATFMYDGAAGTYLDIDCGAANGDVTIAADARSGSYPPLLFKTGATERMRIDASGNLLVGTGSGAFHTIAKSSAGNWALGVNNTSASSPYGMFVNFSGASPNNATSAFMSMSDSTAPRLVFNSNGGIKNYQANDVNLSDEREKNQFGLLDSTTDCVRSWDIVKYLYKDEDQSNPHKYGVIAQQVAEHCPEVISDWIKVPAADEVLWTDEDELPEGVSVGDVKTEAVEQVDRIGVKEQQMFWMLVKSHQEALDTIDALTARIAALES